MAFQPPNKGQMAATASQQRENLPYRSSQQGHTSPGSSTQAAPIMIRDGDTWIFGGNDKASTLPGPCLPALGTKRNQKGTQSLIGVVIAATLYLPTSQR